MSKNEVSYLTGAEQAIPLERLRPFANHPFQVRHDLEMRELMDSIGESGIITPILVRPKEGGAVLAQNEQRAPPLGSLQGAGRAADPGEGAVSGR